MAQPNTNPPFPKVGNNGRGVVLTTAAADYNGVSQYNREVFSADAVVGSFLQKLRFKSKGTNVQTVARIYINNGNINTNWTTAPAAPTGTPSGTGGTILAGTYYGLVIAIGPKGSQSVIGTASAAVNTTGSTSSIAWTWTAIPGAVSYRLYVGTVSGFANRYFTSATNSFNQTLPLEEGTFDDPQTGNSVLYGEISLPATTASNTSATPDIDYVMNYPLPPGEEVYVGLATTVAAGWQVTAVGGDY